ncbi:MAG: alpha/beta hydrolase-fold protein [Saprospiraceae bacterium]
MYFFFRWIIDLIGRLSSPGRVTLWTHHLNSRHLKRRVRIDVYRPPGLPWTPYPLALFNDGQDLPRMDAAAELERAFSAGDLPPLLVVGLHAGDRMREYGTSGRPDYQGRGDLAHAYERFVTEEVLPFLHRRYRVSHDTERRALAGFSLGGLSAFDIVFRNPKAFHVAGVFSGALWWRSLAFNPADPDADRILHDTVLQLGHRPGLRAWFMAGTEDEEADRNNNGVIDAIDDTLHLIDHLRHNGHVDPNDVAYLEVPGGRHEPETWGRVFIPFLRWAFPPQSGRT